MRTISRKERELLISEADRIEQNDYNHAHAMMIELGKSQSVATRPIVTLLKRIAANS